MRTFMGSLAGLLDRVGAQDTVALAALVVVLAWIIVACCIVAYIADQKARSGVAWFLIALVYTPIFATLALVALPPRERLDDDNDYL